MKTTTGRGQQVMERLINRAFKPDVCLEEYSTPDGIRLRATGAASLLRCYDHLGRTDGITEDDYEALLDGGFTVERASKE
jgi:hypothetical protein